MEASVDFDRLGALNELRDEINSHYGFRDGVPRVNLPALILAGGFGTRLRGVLPDLPKLLAPINGRPFLPGVDPHD